MISIIIPLYNKEKYIRSAVESLLKQSYSCFEIVIVDDGSTDSSVEIVQSIKDERITFLKKNNGGPSSARNYGVLNAKYDWILFLDADDKLLPNALEVFSTHILMHNKLDCFYSNFYYEQYGKCTLYSNSYKRKVIKNNFKSYILRKCMPRTGTAVFRKELLVQYPFKNHLRRYEDLEQLFRLFHIAKFYCIPEPLLIYNNDGCEAKFVRKEIKEDYVAYLKLSDGISWENIAIYKMYIEGCKQYPNECNSLYPNFKKKYFLRLITRLLCNKYSNSIYRII